MNARLIAAVLLPFAACFVQWLLWDVFQPYVWFLFFPAAFFSAWLGGLRGGLAGTIIGALLVWFVFIPPHFSFELHSWSAGYSIVVFILMGGLFATFFDRLQQAMHRTDEALAASKAANEKITQLYEKTLELDKLKNQFFANVSHELRTPLTLILAPLTYRLQHSSHISPADRHDFSMMLRSARLLYRHVTDLLDTSKLEAGRMTVAWAAVDLALLVRVMASHFEVLAEEKNIEYEVVTPEQLLVELDSEKIQRVLLNLLSNAFKFTPNAGAIRVTLESKGEQVCILVRDNGRGVPAHLRTAIFERFRQGDGDTQRQHGGTGLGLAIVKEFVELHGGHVDVIEADGGGALFRVYLPTHAPAGTVLGIPSHMDVVLDYQAVEELAAQPLPVSVESSHSLALPLILVVEDNPDMNEFIASALRPHYRVASAFNGREGLEKALALQPDLVLADVMMPVMSGDAMVVALRQEAKLQDLPIVMLTAKADDELRVRLLQQGVQDYLSKPFLVDELLARVSGLIGARKRAHAELESSESRFEATFEQAAVGMAIVAKDGHWLRVNQKLCDIVGYEQAALQKMTFQDITYPEDLTKDLTFAQKMLAGEIKNYATEKRYVHAAGHLIWINLTATLVRQANGAPDYFISIIEDITARKQAESEVLRLNNELEQRVQARTAELMAANSELDSFAYAVSHDLRAPLRAMSGFSQALIEDYGTQLDAQARLFLAQIDLASHKMSDLIDGLLVLSRSTRGEMRVEDVDLTHLAQEIARELAQLEPQRTVQVEIAPNLSASGDPRMLEAVLRNLLGNAWKYTAHTVDPCIRMYQTGASFCIQDNGAGFDPEHANRLFKPFQRLHRQEEFPGIGIGLATVQRIVHRHGGTIHAQGALNQGATFCFNLPSPNTGKQETA